MEITRIALSHVQRQSSARDINTSAVSGIAASMKEIGQLTPIFVRAANIPIKGVMEPGYLLIAGNHRVEAARQLGWSEIDARVMVGESLEAELIEIDENLCRAELTASQRASAIKRRRQIWGALHPEEIQVGKVCPPESATGYKQPPPQEKGFAASTAAVSGESKRAINQHLARADAIGDDLERIKGTSLDKGVELDALKAMPELERKELIDRAAAGEKVSARVSQKSDTKSPDMPTLLLMVINESVERILATADARSILEFADVVKAIPEERRKRIEDALVSLELIGNLCEGVEA